MTYDYTVPSETVNGATHQDFTGRNPANPTDWELFIGRVIVGLWSLFMLLVRTFKGILKLVWKVMKWTAVFWFSFFLFAWVTEIIGLILFGPFDIETTWDIGYPRSMQQRTSNAYFILTWQPTW
ncbi:hypothetical protein LTR84_000259 [Exophiala bonariae]|uniref:Uncharacterized protein n=1 Tax=Exophiala bonariae TaxID=1690606 RepID=A0AAV9NR60_9EURO|nr:hypothetical protein LTR84_000259 [Exophiala bonariae]